MTIQAFAAGTGNFHYEKPFATFGDVFVVASVVGRLTSLGKSASAIKGAAGSLWNVAMTAAGGVFTSQTSPSPMGDTRSGSLTALGLIVGCELLYTSTSFLLMKFSSVEVKLTCRRKNLIFADDVRFARAILNSDDDTTAATMMRNFGIVMNKTGMTDYGALLALSSIFLGFEAKGKEGENGCLLNITLTQ